MAELTWKQAIEKVLNEEKKPLHSAEIAELIAQRGYRTSLGATPQQTVGAFLAVNEKKADSIFTKVDKGIFVLKEVQSQADTDYKLEMIADNGTKPSIKKKRNSDAKIINAFGIYWDKHKVHWESVSPNLFGRQQIGAKEVNFKEQKGIYLLHDSRETIYVGQAIEQTLGKRLKDHTTDRLAGRWNRFSWFGFYPVNDNGDLNLNIQFSDLTMQQLGDILEAILIESIEPRQNRKQGNTFMGLEFLQQEAPEIKQRQKKQMLDELSKLL